MSGIARETMVVLEYCHALTLKGIIALHKFKSSTVHVNVLEIVHVSDMGAFYWFFYCLSANLLDL